MIMMLRSYAHDLNIDIHLCEYISVESKHSKKSGSPSTFREFLHFQINWIVSVICFGPFKRDYHHRNEHRTKWAHFSIFSSSSFSLSSKKCYRLYEISISSLWNKAIDWFDRVKFSTLFYSFFFSLFPANVSMKIPFRSFWFRFKELTLCPFK